MSKTVIKQAWYSNNWIIDTFLIIPYYFSYFFQPILCGIYGFHDKLELETCEKEFKLLSTFTTNTIDKFKCGLWGLASFVSLNLN